MKTNIVMKSADRNLFGVVIKQETSNGFLSVTELQKAYEVARWQYGWSDRKVGDIMQTSTFKERVYYLLKNQNIIKADFVDFIEMTEKEGIAKVLKKLKVYKTTGAREGRVVMCNPYIWILLAMELNPMIYAAVVTWLTDSLIFDRVEAGNEFRPMNTSIKKIIPNPDYSSYSIAINEKVFGKHITGMRNLASADQLKKITRIEQFITQGVEMGMIKNHTQIMFAIKNIGL
jgi:hypothetical protein